MRGDTSVGYIIHEYQYQNSQLSQALKKGAGVWPSKKVRVKKVCEIKGGGQMLYNHFLMIMV